MSGDRTKVGLVLPSSNTTMEWEFARFLPADVSVHATRMLISSGTAEAIAEMSQQLDRCLELLSTADVDVAVYGMTTGSLLEGTDHADELERQIRGELGVPAVATANAVRDALRALDIQTVAVTTPYVEELNDREREFLTASGFDITAISGLGLNSSLAMGELSPDQAASEAKAIEGEGSDGVFVSCTNWRTFERIPSLEAALDKPVVTSNQATLWATLRAVGDSRTPELGRLFET